MNDTGIWRFFLHILTPRIPCKTRQNIAVMLSLLRVNAILKNTLQITANVTGINNLHNAIEYNRFIAAVHMSCAEFLPTHPDIQIFIFYRINSA